MEVTKVHKLVFRVEQEDIDGAIRQSALRAAGEMNVKIGDIKICKDKDGYVAEADVEDE